MNRGKANDAWMNTRSWYMHAREDNMRESAFHDFLSCWKMLQ